MAGSENNGDVPTDQQRNAYKKEIDDLHTWARAREISYRRQRDRWQSVTYYLLGASAIMAVAAAVGAGLSIHLLSVICASISAGLSVINAGLKTVSEVRQSEKSLSEVTLLNRRITALDTDLSGLLLIELKSRIVELRKQAEEAGRLPQPSEKQLKKAVSDIEGGSPAWIATMAPSAEVDP